MKNNIKTRLFEAMVERLEKEDLGFTTPQERRVSHALTPVVYNLLKENQEIQKELFQQTTLELEQSRKQFRDFIAYIEKDTEKLLQQLEKMGMVSYEYDNREKRNVMVTKSTALTHVVAYLNQMNNLIYKFYQDIFKIEQEKEVNKEKIQTTLF